MFMLFTIVIAGLQFQGGQAVTDKGILDGLKPGDRGRIYYLLQVNQREVRIDSIWAAVKSCQDESCTLTLEEPLEPSEGYWIEMDLPGDRISTAGLAEMARRRMADQDFSGAERILPRLRATGSAGRRLADEIQSELSSLRDRVLSRQQQDQLLEEAQTALRNRQFSSFASLFSGLASNREIPAVRIEEMRRQFDRLRGERMVRIDAGSYPIGEDAITARFYNQSPRFRKELETFWIDRWPVTSPEYASRAEFVPASGIPQTATPYADAEAHCRALGKRLPTEFEWEVAASLKKIPEAPLSEWTSSWYLPYPGNQYPEEEFGEIYRVLRGGDSRGIKNPLLRFFMRPHDRQADVGFRCAVEDIRR